MLIYQLSVAVIILILGVWQVRPRINKHLANKGLSLSQLLSGQHRDVALSVSIIAVAVCLGLFYLSLWDEKVELVTIGVFILLISSLCLLVQTLVSLSRSFFWHNVFANGYVFLTISGFALVGIAKIAFEANQIYWLITLSAVWLLGQIIRLIPLSNFPLVAINYHTYCLYFWICVVILDTLFV